MSGEVIDDFSPTYSVVDIKKKSKKKNSSLPKETQEQSPDFSMYAVVDKTKKMRATPAKTLADTDSDMYDVITRENLTDSGPRTLTPKLFAAPLYSVMKGKDKNKNSEVVSSSIDLSSSDNLTIAKMRSKKYLAKKFNSLLQAIILICIALFFIAFIASIAVVFSKVSILKSEVAVLQKETPTGILQSATNAKSIKTLFTMIQDLSKNDSDLEDLSYDRIENLRNLFNVLNKTWENELLSLIEPYNTILFEHIIQLIEEIGYNNTSPAPSCGTLLLLEPSSPSDYYWVRSTDGSAVRVYCDMTRSCGGIAGGWMRVAELNMNNNGAMCPNGLIPHNNNNMHYCKLDANEPRCSSSHYSSYNIEYSQVCGTIRGFGTGSPDGFTPHGIRKMPPNIITINDNYVDGVSLTHGMDPRHHIWTFAARYICQCPNKPAFVANDFFCDSPEVSCSNECNSMVLWDGFHCSSITTPWFYKQLTQPTTDNIEMRVCRDEYRNNEDIAIGVVEIYVK